MAKKKRRKSKKRLRHQRLLWLIGGLFVLVIVASIVSETVIYQNQQTQSENTDHAQKVAWINQLAPYARELQEKYHVIASISIAQAILESDWNTSTLATQYHNLYGIKADTGQKSVVLPTKEYENGQWITIQGRFAAYSSWQESMKAHAMLLYRGTSWNTNQYQHVLAAKDYTTAAQALTQDGYATDPSYAKKLITIIQTWHLDRFDVPTK